MICDYLMKAEHNDTFNVVFFRGENVTKFQFIRFVKWSQVLRQVKNIYTILYLSTSQKKSHYIRQKYQEVYK